MHSTALFVLILVCRYELGSGEDEREYDQSRTLADMRKLMEETSATLRVYQQKTESLMSVVTKQERELQALQADVARLSSEECGERDSEGNKHDPKRVSEVNGTSSSVAFYAQLSADQSNFGTHQTIIFDRVRTNIGSAYNHDDGVFTAPFPGVYIFFWTTINRDNSHMQTELVVNGSQFGRVWADSGNHADYTMASNMVVVTLAAGSTVWIRSDTGHSGFTSGQNFATFSGWLLQNI
ncbi:complement C1q-like protein 4 [Mizuhopecten yessoensis]|uniref:Complement C1q-like protein 4 n=1 Tax=Mizuhopecten yessoensis TaxID=6573 RepID=A0A210Q9H4_MIZYE|nr:complement C1q-like protein 4 [Mizuhopecten yessoensis]OWF45390.1 Complement C1q-like protein 4 [Mizuhopecten yessoensis]